MDSLSSVTRFLLADEEDESDEDEDENLEALFDNDDEDFLSPGLFQTKEKRNCIKNYITKIIPTYTNDEFIKHFRISRNIAKRLSERMNVDGTHNNRLSSSLHRLPLNSQVTY